MKALILIAILATIFIFLPVQTTNKSNSPEDYASLHLGRLPGAYVPNPYLTGMERPLWGPLMPVESKAMTEQKKYTIKSTPWCVPPHNENAPECKNTYIPDIEVPYDLNKI
jgi:hypothetical protein